MVNLPAPFSDILRCKLLFKNPSEIERLERLSTSTPEVAVFEMREQELQQNVFYDTVIVAVASGSTLGGMVAGFNLLGMMSEGSRLR
jgi:hypothetical protein